MFLVSMRLFAQEHLWNLLLYFHIYKYECICTFKAVFAGWNWWRTCSYKLYKITKPGRFEKNWSLSNIQPYQVVSWVNRLMIRFLKSILAWSRHLIDAWTRSTKFTLSVILMNRLELFIIIKTIIDILSMVYHERWFTNEPFMVSVVINGEARLTGLNYFIRLQDLFSEFVLGLSIQSSLSEHTVITENIPRCKINYKLCE